MNTQLQAMDPDGEDEPMAAHLRGSTAAPSRCVHDPAGVTSTFRIRGGIGHARFGGRRFHHAWHELREHADRGLATAEYAIATIAAAGFAGLLIVVLKSGAVRTLLEGIIKSALNV